MRDCRADQEHGENAGRIYRFTVDLPQTRSAWVDPPQVRSFRPGFWDVPPLVLGRSAQCKFQLKRDRVATRGRMYS